MLVFGARFPLGLIATLTTNTTVVQANGLEVGRLVYFFESRLMITSYPLPTCISNHQIICIIQLNTSKIWLDALTWIHACFTNKRLVAELTVPLRRGRSFINWNQSVGWTSPNVSQQCKRVSSLPQKSEQALPAYEVNYSKNSNLWRPTILKTYQRIDQQITFNIFGIPTSQVWGLGTNLLPNWDHLRFEVCLGHRFNLGPHVAWHQPPDTTTTDAGFEQRYVGPEMEATLECRCAKERKERNLGEKGWICLGGIFLGKRANYTWYIIYFLQYIYIYVYIYIYFSFVYIYICIIFLICIYIYYIYICICI